MKIEIEIGLDDLLAEVRDEESGNTYYELKDDDMFESDIKQAIRDDILCNIRYNTRDCNDIINNIIKENKDIIIQGIIDNVSKKIINQKAIKDFKKSLDN